MVEQRPDLAGEAGVDLGVLVERVDLVELQPLAEEARDAGPGARVVDHAPRLRLELLGGAQLVVFGRGEQLVVGHRAPQHVGQARGLLPRRRPLHRLARLRGLADLDAVQEVRRLQHRLHHHLDALVEEQLLLAEAPQREEPLDLVGAERAAEGALAEGLDELARARLAVGLDAAGEHVVDLAGVAIREHLRGVEVALGEQLRHAEDVGVVVESVRLLLGRERAGGSRLVAQEVTHRVVVFGAGQPPERGGGRARSRALARARCRQNQRNDPSQTHPCPRSGARSPGSRHRASVVPRTFGASEVSGGVERNRKGTAGAPVISSAGAPSR